VFGEKEKMDDEDGCGAVARRGRWSEAIWEAGSLADKIAAK